MDDLKKDEKKPEVRKGQIRSFTAKTNTINRKNPKKKKNIKAPILAIKSKKKMKKKVPTMRKSVEIKKEVKHSFKKKNTKPSIKANDHLSEDEVEYEQVSGVNERKRRQ
jgi:hypothetical protein